MSRRKDGRYDRLGAWGFVDAPAPRIGHWHRGHQHLGIGVARVLEDGGARPQLDDTSKIHHADMMRYALNDGNIVADEQE